MNRRVVVTGIGVVAPGGVGTKQFWEFITAGRTATRAISLFDAGQFRSRVAAEVDFDGARAGLTPQELRRLDRAAQFVLVACREALEDSGLAGALDPLRTGVCIGSAVGCTMSLDTEYNVVSNGGRDWLVNDRYAVPHLYDYFVPSSMAAEVARDVGAQGPVAVISTGCTSGLDSIGNAVEVVREGSADVVVTGATEAPISPITMACFDAIKATTPRNDDAEHASRPFDATRNGFVLGEGSAVLVIEELEHALLLQHPHAEALRRDARPDDVVEPQLALVLLRVESLRDDLRQRVQRLREFDEVGCHEERAAARPR